MQADQWEAFAAQHNHFRTVGIVQDLAVVIDLERLRNRGDRQGVDGAANLKLHTIHDCQRERNLDDEGGAFVALAVDGKRAADLFNIFAHNVHTDAAPGKFGDFLIGRKARQHNQTKNFLFGVFGFGLGQQAVFTRLAQKHLRVEPGAVVRDGDDDFAADVFGDHRDAPNVRLALGAAFLDRLDAVIH